MSKSTSTFYLIFCCLSASICMFNINYNFNVINIPQKFIKQCKQNNFNRLGFSKCLDISEGFWSYVVSSISIGGFFGCFLAILLTSTLLGRKNTLIHHNVLYLIGGLLICLSNSKYLFLVGRIFIGVAGAISQVVAPMYIAEITPAYNRGFMSLIAPIIGDIGTIVALFLSIILSDYYLWRILLGITIIPATLQIVLGFFITESPRYLLICKNNEYTARTSLRKLRHKSTLNNEHIDNEIDEIKKGINKKALDIEFNQFKAIRLLFTKQYRLRFLLVALILAGQGLSGITVIDYYSQPILAAFYSQKSASIYLTLFSVLGIVVSIMVMFYIDIIGRKNFLLYSQLGAALSCFIIAIGDIYNTGNFVLLGLLAMRVFYGLGLSCIPFVVAAEFFPTYLVSGGNSIVMSICWLSHFCVGFTFNYLQLALKKYVFLIFCVSNLTIVFVLFVFMPETKGKSIESIDDQFDSYYNNEYRLKTFSTSTIIAK